jgi:tRNA threonylcarbamoyladenosine biosynthesis protein TsaE
MGESSLSLELESEVALKRLAGRVARRWVRLEQKPLIVGLRGELGAGKTTWVRAMLRGLGFMGRVPSPTYTLLEHYEIDGLTLVHLDLYRLDSDEDLEAIGVRDWLQHNDVCLLAEWPGRAPRFERRCDVLVDFEIVTPEARMLGCRAQTPVGRAALAALSDLDSS